MPGLLFLKLGGSVITDKNQPNTADIVMLDEIATEIHQALDDDPKISLVIGHGSGSFGHHAANKYGTRNGVNSARDWEGFCEVALRARQLNQIVLERLIGQKIKAVSCSPFSCLRVSRRQPVDWNTTILAKCLDHHLVPVIYGDVLFDDQMGGTILSTEELFVNLALQMHPQAILLAGLEEGIWSDFPARTNLVREITPQNYPQLESSLMGSGSIDVTGGMRSKVTSMLNLTSQIKGLEISIFSAKHRGNIRSALTGKRPGTLIVHSKG